METPKTPNLKKQPSAPNQEANVIWMKCRAKRGCEGNYAKLTLVQHRTVAEGGGTWKRFRCQTCGGVWSFTS